MNRAKTGMMMAFLRLEIVTKMDRNHALTLVRQAIATCEGWIVHHQLFSNLAATIVFEMPSEMATRFVAGLEEAGLSPEIVAGMPSRDAGDTPGSIALTFIHNDPDMKRDVPAFG